MNTVEKKITLSNEHCRLYDDHDSGVVHPCPMATRSVGLDGFSCLLFGCNLNKKDGEDVPTRAKTCRDEGNNLRVILTDQEVLPPFLHTVLANREEQERCVVAERAPNCMISVTPVGSDKTLNIHINEFNRRMGLLDSRRQKRKGDTDEPVEFIKELGFDSAMGIVGDKSICTEKLFFVDAFGNESFNATDEAIKTAIAHWRHDVETLELYLKNSKNNNTHEWKAGKTEDSKP